MLIMFFFAQINKMWKPLLLTDPLSKMSDFKGRVL